MNLFDIDIKGFKQTLAGEADRILIEPISNALDTGASNIEINFKWIKGGVMYTVIDDDPDGFANLRDAYTLFAPSTRKADATKRGRFGFGEKEFIALCYPGTVNIASTTGTVTFQADKRIETKEKTREGSRITSVFRLVKDDALKFIDRVLSLLVPDGQTVTFTWKIGGEATQTRVLKARPVVRSFSVKLPTVTVDEDGNLRPSTRTTTVSLYETEKREFPTIYELGVPVVEHDGRWHVDIAQKVPLNRNRDNVTPSYLRQLREAILNETFDLLTSVEAKKAWVTEALPKASPEALKKVVHSIHGANAVIYDPSNPEASKKAIEQGRSVIHGRQFTTAAWNAIKANDIVKPAGQVIETGVKSDPNGVPPIPRSEWTAEMIALEDYVLAVGVALLGFAPSVRFHKLNKPYLAWWGSRTITFNLQRLGKAWPGSASQEDVDALILHEFAHHFASDHYSSAFYDGVAQLGAKLRNVTARLPR